MLEFGLEDRDEYWSSTEEEEAGNMLEIYGNFEMFGLPLTLTGKYEERS